MPRTRGPSLYATALAYLAAGRSVVPIAPGFKAPSLSRSPALGGPMLIRWERYQDARATPDEVRRWFAGCSSMGLGLVAGPVSGSPLADGTRAGLEVLDFDDAEVHARFVALVAAVRCRLAAGGPGLRGDAWGWAPLWLSVWRMVWQHDPRQAPQVSMRTDASRFKTLIESQGRGRPVRRGAHARGDSPRPP